MRKFIALLFLLSLAFFVQPSMYAQNRNIQRLADITIIHLDEKSFSFEYSSCSKRVAGFDLPCEDHQRELQKFVAALNRWLVKYDIAVTTDPEQADAVLQGKVTIDDVAIFRNNEAAQKRAKNKDIDTHYYEEAQWSVRAWLANQNGKRLWTSDGLIPGISYKWSGQAKVEGKKLAREIQYDIKESK